MDAHHPRPHRAAGALHTFAGWAGRIILSSRPFAESAPGPPGPRQPGQAVHRTSTLITNLLCGLCVCAPVAAAAQEPYSPLVPRGTVRLGLRGDYYSFSSRYGLWGSGTAGLEQLSDAFSGPADADVFPQLDPFATALRNAAGEQFAVSLGMLDAVMEQATTRVPVSLDVGVFDWLTVGAEVPFVRSDTEFSLTFAADSAHADAGFSPGMADPGLVTGFLSGLQNSITMYDAFRASTCSADPNSPECRDATALVADARIFRNSLATMYGTMFAPVGWSPAGVALQARLTALAEAFQAAGVTGTPGSVPLAAGPLTFEELLGLVMDPAHGIAASYPLENWQSLWALGDIEARVDARLLESGDPEGPSHVFAGAGALVRLPTGQQDDPANFIDVGSGDAQMDIEARAWMNGRWRRVGLWADLRYGVQMTGTTERRAFDPNVTFAPLASQVQLDWNPGDYQFLELSPWYEVAPTMRLLAGYRYFRKGMDAFAIRAAPPPDTEPPAGMAATAFATTEAGLTAVPDPEALVPESGASSSRLMLGLVYNRDVAVGDGVAGRPLEIRAVYRHVVGGSGGNVPNARSFEAGFRFFVRLWGG